MAVRLVCDLSVQTAMAAIPHLANASGSYHVHRDGITGNAQMPSKIENGMSPSGSFASIHDDPVQVRLSPIGDIGADARKRLRLARIRYFQSHDFLWRIAFERRKM